MYIQIFFLVKKLKSIRKLCAKCILEIHFNHQIYFSDIQSLSIEIRIHVQCVLVYIYAYVNEKFVGSCGGA